MIESLHFIRPHAFWLVLLLVFLLWRIYKSTRHNNAWSDVCDPQLLTHLLVGTGKKRNYIPLFLMFVVGVLVIIAMAGPAWEKLPQPVFKNESARVFVLDMSRSMDATDIVPNRAERAKLKLIDFLKANKEGLSALVVFAGSSHIVSPLSDDSNTIAAMVPGLSPGIMPQQGGRSDLAIKKAAQLLTQAGSNTGEIILITDGITREKSIDIAEKISAHGYRLSVVGVGTVEGAPIPIGDGGFLKDASGAIVLPKLDRAALKELALAGSGLYLDFAVDDRDIKKIITPMVDQQYESNNPLIRDVDLWQDEGHWFLLMALPFAVLAFRRGWLGSVLLISFLTPIGNEAIAFEWQDLWQTRDQQAQEKLKQGEVDEAATMFEDRDWKGTALYRSENYEQAAEYFSQSENPDAQYNHANALAKSGKLQEAVDLYDQLLDENPDHADAQFNKELVEKLLKQQQSQNQDSDNEKNSEDQQNQEQNQDQQQSGGEQSESEQQQSQNQEQQSDSSQSNSEQQQEQDQDQQQEQSQSAQESDEEKSEQESEQMQQQQQAEQEQDPEGEQQDVQQTPAEQAEQKETRQATEQWLRRIPDDPGGLLREKFRRQSQRQGNQQNVENPW